MKKYLSRTIAGLWYVFNYLLQMEKEKVYVTFNKMQLCLPKGHYQMGPAGKGFQINVSLSILQFLDQLDPWIVSFANIHRFRWHTFFSRNPADPFCIYLTEICESKKKQIYKKLTVTF